jgi:hypothetical protein
MKPNTMTLKSHGLDLLRLMLHCSRSVANEHPVLDVHSTSEPNFDATTETITKQDALHIPGKS